MKIAVFTNEFPAKVNSFFARDISALLENGNDIKIFPIRPLNEKCWSLIPKFLVNNKKFKKQNIVHIIKKDFLNLSIYFDFIFNIKIILPILKSSLKFGFFAFSKTFYSILCSLILNRKNKNEFDHILAYWGNFPATYAYLFNKLINKNTHFSILLHAGTDLYRQQIFLKEKLLFAKNIFVVCQFNKNFIGTLYPDIYNQLKEKIYIHHLGIDLNEYKVDVSVKKEDFIIAVGRIEFRKGYDILLKALKKITFKENRDFLLKIVGDGPQLEELKKYTRDKKIDDKVLFLGWLNYENVKKEIAKAKILIHPSPMIGDAVPTVIKEAMALQTPVIGTEIAGIPELLNYGKCGILIKPKSVDELVSEILRLYFNKELQSQYVKNAQKHLNRILNLDSNIKKMCKILKDNKC